MEIDSNLLFQIKSAYEAKIKPLINVDEFDVSVTTLPTTRLATFAW